MTDFNVLGADWAVRGEQVAAEPGDRARREATTVAAETICRGG
jgi:hypothetical protein